MTTFMFRTKEEISEWKIRQTFSELDWGIIWKIEREPGPEWTNLVYYAVLTKSVSDRIWIDGWVIRKICQEI